MIQNVILCDIDHTIADSFWRDDMIGAEGGWDAYHAAAKDDKPIPGTVAMVNSFYKNGFQVFALTMRPEKWRQLTQDWMLKHSVKFDQMIMRPDDDYRKSAICKPSIAVAAFGSEEELRRKVLMVVEDREDICEVFRGMGLTVLKVYAGRNAS